MYETFFHFSSQPFKLNPDPKFFFGSKSHNKAMAYLHYGLRQAEGFIVITGEIGAGKSMLIGHLIDQLDRSNVVAAHLLTPNLKAEDLLSHILSAFRIEPAGDGKASEIEAFEDFLFDQMNRGRRVLLIVDEAQNLRMETLEELRILSNIDYDGTPLFQVFLVGQPDFKPILADDNMEQLRQRVIASYNLEPLNAPETKAYILHRLKVVGWDNNPTISDEAFELIHEATSGVPRKVNKLCNRILLHCAIDKKKAIDGQVVRAVVSDLASEDVSGKPMKLSPPATIERANQQAAHNDAARNTVLSVAANEAMEDEGAAPEKAGDLQIEEKTEAAAPEDVKSAPEEPKDTPVRPQASPQQIVEKPQLPKIGNPAPLRIVASNEAHETPEKRDPQRSMPDVAPALEATSGKQVTKGSKEETATMSVLDRLKAQRADKSKHLRAAEKTAPSPATLNDVATALVEAGLGEKEEATRPPPKVTAKPNGKASPNNHWQSSVTKSIDDTRADLKDAHTKVSRLRSQLEEIEHRRAASKDKIAASLDRAESLLAEIRDAWR